MTVWSSSGVLGSVCGHDVLAQNIIVDNKANTESQLCMKGPTQKLIVDKGANTVANCIQRGQHRG